MIPYRGYSRLGTFVASCLLLLALLAGAGAARAQTDYRPGADLQTLAFRPGSSDELLLVEVGESSAEVVLAAVTDDSKLATKMRLKGPYLAAAFLDRDRIVTADRQGELALWAPDGRRLGTLARIPLGKDTVFKAGIAVSSRAGLIAVRYPGHPIRLFTATGQQAVPPLGKRGKRCSPESLCDDFGTTTIVFTPDESTLIGSDVDAKLLAATVRGRMLPIAGKQELYVNRIALSRDGRMLMTGYTGMPGGGGVFRNLAADRIGAARKAPGPFDAFEPQDIAALPGGFVVATLNRLRFMAGDGRPWRADIELDAPRRLAVSAQGDRMAVAAAEGVVLFDGAGMRLRNRPFAEFGVPIVAEALPGGNTALTLSDYGQLRVWTPDGTLARPPVAAWSDRDSGDWLHWHGRLMLAPDRKAYAVVTPARTLQIYDVAGVPRGPAITLRTREKEERPEAGAFALLGERVVVPAPDGLSLMILDLTGAVLARDIAPHRYAIKALAFAPDGSRFVTHDGGDGTLRLWSAEGKLLRERRGDREVAGHSRLAFAPDGRTVVSYDYEYRVREDGRLTLWHIDNGDRIEQRAGRFLRFLADSALARHDRDRLLIDAPDGALRSTEQLRAERVHVVFDDAATALVSERGVARVLKLRPPR